MVEMSLKFDEADIAAFNREMARIVDVLKKTPKDAVNMGTIALIQSLRASIRRGKKNRKVVESKSGSGKLVKGNKIFYVERWSKKKKQMVKVPILAESFEQAKLSPKANIKFSGLGIAVMSWTMMSLFNKGAPNVSFRQPSGIQRTSRVEKGNEYGIDIENNTNYIPFKTKGKQALTTAMMRATAAMRGRTEQRLKGTFK